MIATTQFQQASPFLSKILHSYIHHHHSEEPLQTGTFLGGQVRTQLHYVDVTVPIREASKQVSLISTPVSADLYSAITLTTPLTRYIRYEVSK